MKNKILIIEICNYEDYPAGGQLTFARQLMKAFGEQLVLAGISTDDTPVGEWKRKTIDGMTFDYFAFCRFKKISGKPIIPGRLKGYLSALKYIKKIFSKNIQNVFIQSPEILFFLPNNKLNVCYRFAGIENFIFYSRYKQARFLAPLYENFFFSKFEKVNTVLAAADTKAIEMLKCKSKNHLTGKKVISFPTRVNTEIFNRRDKPTARKKLSLPPKKEIIITTGRINTAKGWSLVIESFELYLKKNAGSFLIFVGDGEDRIHLEKEIKKRTLDQNVLITGFVNQQMVSDYLNSADIFLMCSEFEGWSTSLVEALAVHLPIITTKFSSADSIVKDGVNGFVIDGRKPEMILKGLQVAKNLEHPSDYFKMELEKYALRNLKKDLLSIWTLK